MHQPYRAELVPGLEEALRLRAPGLLGCALSGAGPSIIVFFERGFEEVSDLVCQIFAFHGRKAEVIAAQIARDGYSVQVQD
jgi:homoserine kinase